MLFVWDGLMIVSEGADGWGGEGRVCRGGMEEEIEDELCEWRVIG